MPPIDDELEGVPLVGEKEGESPPPAPLARPLELIRRAESWLWQSGTACILLASLIFSLSAVLVKVAGDRLPVTEIALSRSAVSMVAGLTSARVKGLRPVWGKREHYPILTCRGTFGSLSMLFRYEAFLLIPLADAVTLAFLAPCLTALLAAIVLGEQFGPRAIVGCSASLLGVALVSRPTFIFGGDPPPDGPGVSLVASHRAALGVSSAVLSAALTSANHVTLRVVGERERALTLTLWFHAFSIAFCVAPMLYGWPAPPRVPTPREFACLAGIGCTSFTAQLLQGRSFQLLPAARASSFSFTQVPYAAVFSTIFFGTSLSLHLLSGAALIACGVTLVSFDRARESRAAAPPADPLGISAGAAPPSPAAGPQEEGTGAHASRAGSGWGGSPARAGSAAAFSPAPAAAPPPPSLELAPANGWQAPPGPAGPFSFAGQASPATAPAYARDVPVPPNAPEASPIERV